MAERRPDITFVIPGQIQPAAGTRGAGVTGSPSRPGRVKTAVRVGTQRGSGDLQRVVVKPDDDVVVLTIANGPTLVLSAESARDLMRAQSASTTRSAFAGKGNAADVEVSAQLGWPGLEANATRGVTRGWMGQAVLSAFEVVTDLVKGPVVGFASAAITKKVDGGVDAGVYKLKAQGPLLALKTHGDKKLKVDAADDGGPLLILVHGTFVDTVSTFGKLWDLHAAAVRDLFARYHDRVYALDHPTMGVSPIGNALTLASALPADARLHLVTHSRGGLVAEVLARACAGQALTADERALFSGDAFAQHLRDLDALIKACASKGLKVERVVRVACPARGTLLASKRLDAYLSVLQWGLQIAGVPVAPELVDFLHEVARRRAEPTELPGLEAMMPGSPVVAWLNNGAAIPGDLRVIAGDMEGDSIGSWVKTLLADAFYWTDNDIVVQTRSMYGGSARNNAGTVDGEAGAASFLLDRGGKVSHFNYFANDRTVGAIAAALTEDAPEDFETIGPLSWAGKDASGTRGARAVARSRGADGGAAVADRPAVFVLPGILGSNLALNGKRIWLGLRFVNGLQQLAWNPATASTVTPDGPIESSYDDLLDRLAETHEVIPFAFDWRRPIEDEARRLADSVDQALAARGASLQPVRLLAHSMGGLVARTMALERPETWQRLMARDGSRLVMLGTPNGGSWAPMQTLSGDDTFGNALVAFGALFDNGGARKMMAGMPGFLQLQAGLLDPAWKLDQASSWQKLADDDMALLAERSIWHDEGPQRAVYEWGAPPQEVLDQAVALRRRLDAQAAALGVDATKMLLVVGHADATPSGIVLDQDGLSYLDVSDGDGRVTRQGALLQGVKTWTVAAEHGKLPSTTAAFGGYLELLTTGATLLLDALDTGTPAARGTAAAMPSATGSPALASMTRSRPSRGLQSHTPPSDGIDVMSLARSGTDDPRRVRSKGAAVRMSVYNGDLKFVREPLLLGHYRAMRLTGTEEVVDKLVAKAMSGSLNAGLYPDPPGTHQIFTNRREDPDNVFDMARPAAVIVAGLGEEGKLRAVDLVCTVRQAVLAYAQRVAEETPEATGFEMAVTLLGSGGTGISAGSAAQQIAQGAIEASRRLQASRWPQLVHLKFVEIYLERAADAWRALKMQQDAAPNSLQVVGEVQFGPGARRRSLDSSYRGSAYDFISALGPEDPGAPPSITYTLDTKRARTEVRAQRAQGTLVSQLVADASNDANQDPLIGRTLFNLLVPVEMEPFLAGTTEMVIEVNAGTAVIPWELLDTNPDEQSTDRRPWSIRCKLLRKLRLEDFRGVVTDASADDDVLVIGEPLTDPDLYPPLPGARAEAQAVAAKLSEAGSGVGADRVLALTSGADNAQTIINALFARRYRVVHIAGHGFAGEAGGVVLSGKNTYLGSNEVRAMRTVPELVFLNCCHLAGRDASTTLKPYDRAAFAANIAEELIRVGVRCVIAAGWAVEDKPAEIFATTFYASLLGGARFIEAVSAARSAAWRAAPSGNTWAAYQCYGDPEWAWNRQVADTQQPASSLAEQFAAVASPVSLAVALENLAIASEYGDSRFKSQGQRDRVHYLDAKYKALWGNMGAVAEAFGVAYVAVGETDKAIEWYRIAVDAADGSASFKAAEQLGNWLVRRAEESKDASAAATDFKIGIALLERMAGLQSTSERHNLLGSAYRRLTMFEWRAHHWRAAEVALKAAIDHCVAAAGIARKTDAEDLFYPAKNAISGELRRDFITGQPPAISAERFAEVRRSMQKKAAEHPDFWSAAGQTELQVLEAVAERRLARSLKPVLDNLRELKARVPSVRMWDSVYDEAKFTLEPYQAQHGIPEAELRAAAILLATLQQMASVAA